MYPGKGKAIKCTVIFSMSAHLHSIQPGVTYQLGLYAVSQVGTKHRSEVVLLRPKQNC